MREACKTNVPDLQLHPFYQELATSPTDP